MGKAGTLNGCQKHANIKSWRRVAYRTRDLSHPKRESYHLDLVDMRQKFMYKLKMDQDSPLSHYAIEGAYSDGRISVYRPLTVLFDHTLRSADGMMSVRRGSSLTQAASVANCSAPVKCWSAAFRCGAEVQFRRLRVRVRTHLQQKSVDDFNALLLAMVKDAAQASSLSHLVIVFDALDECFDRHCDLDMDGTMIVIDAALTLNAVFLA